MLKKGDLLSGVYEIIQEIGAGGTGVIYLGYHRRLQKQIVIKRIKDNYTGRINVRGEADILKKLHHRYLPQVYDFIVFGQDVYTVMDYIPGRDLKYYLDHRYSFPEEILVKWLRQLCDVLDYLHTQKPQILHSDIKPGNIMITPEGDICLIDFNISLDGTEKNKIQGISPYYAAPEQYRCAEAVRFGGGIREKLDERMDIYSLGAVFYRMMTGYLPDPKTGVPYDIEAADIPYSGGIKGVIAKATQYSPAQRFRNVRQMLKAMDSMEKMDPQYRMLDKIQILSGILYGACLAAGILMCYGGFGVWQKEAWQNEYSRLYQAADSGDESRIITTGTQMLNDFLLKGYAGKHPEEKAEVLYILGESYYRQEQYGDAAKYYLEALKESQKQSVYLREYLAASARNGEKVSAEEMQRKYPKAVISQAEMVFVEIQSAYASGQTEDALAKSEQAMQLSADPELTAAILGLRADIYSEQGDYQKAYEELYQASTLVSDKNILRKSGQLAFEAGNEAGNATESRTAYEHALEIYEKLCTEKDPSYEDQLNRALTLRALGRYETSIKWLKDMQKQYSEDYRVLMWMCYNYLDEAAVEEDPDKNWSELNFCYNSCRHIYDAGNVEDNDMEALIEIMNNRE